MPGPWRRLDYPQKGDWPVSNTSHHNLREAERALLDVPPRYDDEPLQGQEEPDVEVMIAPSPDDAVTIDPETGAAEVRQPDGSIIVYPHGIPPSPREGPTSHDANLAEHIEEGELNRIAADLLQGIASDEQSRQEWLDDRARGIVLLATKVEEAKKGTGDDTAAESVSSVRSTLLLETTLTFQANADAELLPANGPVKVTSRKIPKTDKQKQKEAAAAQASGQPDESDETDTLAMTLEQRLNKYLTTRAKEYYPDTRRMLFYTGFGGCGFKKVYRCPLRRRPVSDAVDAKDLIVSNDAVDLRSSGRYTIQSKMRPSVLKRMQLAGSYRQVDIPPPGIAPGLNPVEQKESEATGQAPAAINLPSDTPHTIYEVYAELDIAGFEHKERGQPTGLALPYKITIEKDSQKVVEIRRNWKEGDDSYFPKCCVVRYPLVEALGFYCLGFLNILGNSTAATTGALRMMLDAGMYASFPGFLYTDAVARQDTNTFRIPPGGGRRVSTGGQAINQAVMPLPYKDPSPGLMEVTKNIQEKAQRVGGVVDIAVGEGRQDAPVGTTLALIDQATKIMAASHKGLCSAQAEELQLLRELFIEDPEALFWAGDEEWEREQIIEALNTCDIVSQADPNTPSQTHRLMKAEVVAQRATGNPLYDPMKVEKKVLHSAGISDPEDLFAPPAPPAPDPMMQIAQMQADIENRKTDVKIMELQFEKQKVALEAQISALDREAEQIGQEAEIASRERIAALKAQTDRLKMAIEALRDAESVKEVEDFIGAIPKAKPPKRKAN